MPTLERRVAALETKANAAEAFLMKVVFVKPGETDADVLERAGYAPDAADVLRVVFVSTADAKT